jgi:hypothetical protein
MTFALAVTHFNPSTAGREFRAGVGARRSSETRGVVRRAGMAPGQIKTRRNDGTPRGLLERTGRLTEVPSRGTPREV